MKEVDIDDIDCDENFCYLFQDSPFTGVAAERFPSGALSSQTFFSNGMKHGPHTEWPESGMVLVESGSSKNMAHGRHRKFHEDGSIILDSEYEHGICLWRRRYEHGIVLEDYKVENDGPSLRHLERSRQSNG